MVLRYVVPDVEIGYARVNMGRGAIPSGKRMCIVRRRETNEKEEYSSIAMRDGVIGEERMWSHGDVQE